MAINEVQRTEGLGTRENPFTTDTTTGSTTVAKELPKSTAKKNTIIRKAAILGLKAIAVALAIANGVKANSFYRISPSEASQAPQSNQTETFQREPQTACPLETRTDISDLGVWTSLQVNDAWGLLGIEGSVTDSTYQGGDAMYSMKIQEVIQRLNPKANFLDLKNTKLLVPTYACIKTLIQAMAQKNTPGVGLIKITEGQTYKSVVTQLAQLQGNLLPTDPRAAEMGDIESILFGNQPIKTASGTYYKVLMQNLASEFLNGIPQPNTFHVKNPVIK